MKKIKNPEKYIKSLKVRINDLEHLNDNLREDWRKAQGKIVTTWTGYEGEQGTIHSFSLAVLRPGDRIAIICKIKKVKSWIEEGCNNKGSRINYDVLETRKID